MDRIPLDVCVSKVKQLLAPLDSWSVTLMSSWVIKDFIHDMTLLFIQTELQTPQVDTVAIYGVEVRLSCCYVLLLHISIYNYYCIIPISLRSV